MTDCSASSKGLCELMLGSFDCEQIAHEARRRCRQQEPFGSVSCFVASPPLHPPSSLHPHRAPVPEEPGFAINMDFVFGLPKTKRGHTGYLSMTCRLSNWLQVALCAEEVTAEGAAQLVFDRWVVHYGLPAIILSGP